MRDYFSFKHMTNIRVLEVSKLNYIFQAGPLILEMTHLTSQLKMA